MWKIFYQAASLSCLAVLNLNDQQLSMKIKSRQFPGFNNANWEGLVHKFPQLHMKAKFRDNDAVQVLTVSIY